MTRGDRVAAAALAMVGTRFRLHGRDEGGVDCVGLVARALKAGGFEGAIPTGYALRCGDAARVAAAAAAAGLVAAEGDAAAGEVLLMRPAAGQLHLGIAVAGGFVHADAGAGRVVARPGSPPWPVLARWRMGEG